MGNNQTLQRRERAGDGRQRASSGSSGINQIGEDGCPVQVKIPKSRYRVTNSNASIQSNGTMEYPVVFKWQGGSHPKNVYISGTWDQWRRKIPLVKSAEDFSTIINLQEGTHEYKYLVDGKWMVDETLGKTDNRMGTQNNVIDIDKAEFEVFNALDRDMASSNAGELLRNMAGIDGQMSHDTPNDRELEKLKVIIHVDTNFDTHYQSFGQELPDRVEFELAHNPPILPPHLLQVILNKDTPVQCDPNVLPEPNHVMLNHLYALSIKDGVMVLSATHRYRKKYVTTLLYKPI